MRTAISQDSLQQKKMEKDSEEKKKREKEAEKWKSMRVQSLVKQIPISYT